MLDLPRKCIGHAGARSHDACGGEEKTDEWETRDEEMGSVHGRLEATRKGIYIKRQIAPALFCVAS